MCSYTSLCNKNDDGNLNTPSGTMQTELNCLDIGDTPYSVTITSPPLKSMSVTNA
jgi:hypothetical protein